MNREQFSKTYMQHEKQIKKMLRELEIYDEDRLHDTYIALYEQVREIKIRGFAETFVKYYRTLQRRVNEHDARFIPCTPNEMVARYDRPDESDLEYREQVAERVDEIIEEYRHHPFTGERSHRRAVRILQLYRSGLSLQEIGWRLEMSKQGVQKLMEKTAKNLRTRHSKRER